MNFAIMNIPDKIYTSRLLVRRIQERDWEDIREIWADFHKSEYSCYDRYIDTSEEEVKRRVSVMASYSRSTEHMFYGVCFGNTVIGFFSFSKEGNGYETGYCFHSGSHGKGYAKESFIALKEAIKKTGADHISAGTALRNIPSFEFLTSCGFFLMGTQQMSFYKDEQGNDIYFEGGYFVLPL